MTTLQKTTMYQQIEQHGKNLNAIFNTGIDPVKLCKSLRRLELKSNKIATDWCNGVIDTEDIEPFIENIMKSVYKLLNNGIYKDERPHQRKIPIFFNGDARGYSLKINDAYVKSLQTQGKNIYTDLGGFGIICPDFTPNN